MRAPECAVPVAQEDADRVTTKVGNRQVQLAVTVEIADGHGIRRRADGVVMPGLKKAVAGSQQHAHAVAVFVGRDQVLSTIAIKVADRRRSRALPSDVVADRWAEKTEQHTVLKDADF